MDKYKKISSGQILDINPDEITSYQGGAEGFAKEYTKVDEQPQPTAGQVYSGLVSTQDPNEQAAYDTRESVLKESQAPIDEGQIRQNALNRFQGEIDAINKMYAEKKREEILRGEGRLGSSAAIQAKRGLLGSDFGASQTKKQVSENVAAESAIDIEKTREISSILSQARQEAQAEIAAKKLARQSGSKDYIEFLQGVSERKDTRVKNTVANIIARDTELDDAGYNQVAKQLGISTEDLKRRAKEAKEAKAKEAAKDKKLTGYAPGTSIYDETGKLIATVPEKPSDGKPTTVEVGNSLLQYDPKTNSWSSVYTAPKDVTQKIVKIDGVDYVQNADGTFSKPTVPTTPTDIKATQDQLDLVKKSIKTAKELAGASGRSGVRKSFESNFIGSTDYTNLVALTNTLRTNALTLLTDPNIKKFFGPSMSNADVVLMSSGGTTLNPELQSPEALNSELTRLEDLVNRIESSVKSGGTSPTTVETPLQKAYNTNSITGDDGKPLDYATAVQQAGGEAQLQKILEANGVKVSFNTSPSMDSNGLKGLADSIVTQESGGKYTAVGDVPAGYNEEDRALGKYQIVPKYHFAKIGLANTPADRQRFLNSPELQDQLFQRILAGLAQQYQNDPKKIAAAYYGGKAAADVVGTPAGDRPQYAGGKQYPSINQYVNSVVGRMS